MRQPQSQASADFISKADTDESTNRARNFKAIRVPFNQSEYNTLERLAEKTGRSKLNAIRWAISQAEKSLD